MIDSVPATIPFANATPSMSPKYRHAPPRYAPKTNSATSCIDSAIGSDASRLGRYAGQSAPSNRSRHAP